MDGHGFKARIWFSISFAGLFQSIFPSSLVIFEQNVALLSFCGIGERIPFSISFNAKGSINAATWASFIESFSVLSYLSIATRFIRYIGPWSSFSSSFIMEIPVLSSPFRSVSWIGDAPLYRGSREGWMFMQPCFGKSNNSFGISPPYATTRIASGLSSLMVFMKFLSIFFGWWTFSPNFSASILTGGGVIFLLSPGLSGCVTTEVISK